MKTLRLICKVSLAAFVMLGMASCQKEFELSKSTVKLNQGEKYTISYENGTNLVYTSDNPYVATVDDSGVVTANFVGKANINVTASEGQQVLKVNVEPLYTIYEEPCLDFTLDKTEIYDMYEVSYLGKSTDGSLSMLFFKGGDKYAYGYYFDENELQGVYVWCQYTSMDKVLDFLGERYYYEGEYEAVHIYTNWTDLAIGTITYKGHQNFGYGTLVYYYSMDFSEMTNSRSLTMFGEGLKTMQINSYK